MFLHSISTIHCSPVVVLCRVLFTCVVVTVCCMVEPTPLSVAGAGCPIEGSSLHAECSSGQHTSKQGVCVGSV